MSWIITGIILAAGESKRMGNLKQLLPWRDTTILQRVIANATKSNLSSVIVVLGYRADEISATLGRTTARVVVNFQFKFGMSSSLKCGISHAAQNSQAFMSILGDEPLVGTGIINMLIERYCEGKYGIVIPVYGGRRGHPVIFDRKYRDKLLTLDDVSGARGIIRANNDDVLEVPADSNNILIDIDTVEDYVKARRIDDNED